MELSRPCVDIEPVHQTVTANITEMSKKGKEGGMDKEKELGKLYKELAGLRYLHLHLHHLHSTTSTSNCTCTSTSRPSDEFEPEQEDWEKAVKVCY